MRTHSIAPAFHVALIRFRGHVRGKDLIAATRGLHGDTRWRTSMDMVWDCRAVTSLDIVPQEMVEVVDLRTENTEGRDASVVQRTLDEVIAKLYRMVAERKGKRAFVCHTMEEALDALDLKETAREELELGLASDASL